MKSANRSIRRHWNHRASIYQVALVDNKKTFFCMAFSRRISQYLLWRDRYKNYKLRIELKDTDSFLHFHHFLFEVKDLKSLEFIRISIEFLRNPDITKYYELYELVCQGRNFPGIILPNFEQSSCLRRDSNIREIIDKKLTRWNWNCQFQYGNLIHNEDFILDSVSFSKKDEALEIIKDFPYKIKKLFLNNIQQDSLFEKFELNQILKESDSPCLEQVEIQADNISLDEYSEEKCLDFIRSFPPDTAISLRAPCLDTIIVKYIHLFYSHVNLLRRYNNNIIWDIELTDAKFYYKYDEEIYQVDFTKLGLMIVNNNNSDQSFLEEAIVIQNGISLQIHKLEGWNRKKIIDDEIEPAIFKLFEERDRINSEYIIIPKKGLKVNLNLINAEWLEFINNPNFAGYKWGKEETKEQAFKEGINDTTKVTLIKWKFTIDANYYTQKYLIDIVNFMKNHNKIEGVLNLENVMLLPSFWGLWATFKNFHKVVVNFNSKSFLKMILKLSTKRLNLLKMSLLDSYFPQKIEFNFGYGGYKKLTGFKIILDKSDKLRCEEIFNRLFKLKNYKEYLSFRNSLFSIYLLEYYFNKAS